MKATFENSVSVLVRAYMNDTLVATDCTACAVGNLIADARGYAIGNNEWCRGWYKDGKLTQAVAFWFPLAAGFGEDEVRDSGYTKNELRRIEVAFMHSHFDYALSLNPDYFPNLIAVVDVLAEIHGVDLSVKEQAIGQFETVHATK